MSKTHWKRLINPDYIGAYSIPEGEDMTVTIVSVAAEEVTGTGGKKDVCTVAQLRGQKPWILNVTNQKSIAKLYGPYIEDWAGKKVTLYATTTRMGGEVVECVRVRPKVAEIKPKPISDDRFKKALEAVKAGTYAAEKVKANFALSNDQAHQLAEVANV